MTPFRVQTRNLGGTQFGCSGLEQKHPRASDFLPGWEDANQPAGSGTAKTQGKRDG